MTLTRLCKEILREFNLKSEIPEDYSELKRNFFEILEKVQDLQGQKKLLIIIDALNQFDEAFNASSLNWLPEVIRTGVKFLVSTLKGSVLDNIRRREDGPAEVLVGELAVDERKEIVRQTLWEYRKKLDERPGKDQMAMLLSKKDAHKPLYLITACEELRVFGVYEQVSDRIKKMSDKVGQLLEEVLERLEGDHGKEFVATTLSLLNCAREGLLEVELLQILGVSPFAWSRLYRSMSAFLRPPGESGEGMLDFFHRQLAKAVERRYLSGGAGQQRRTETHRKLAYFFLQQADPTGDFSWSSDHLRGLGELPFHLVQAREYAKLKEVLSDLLFIEKKCAAGMTYELVGDYLAAVQQDDISDQIKKDVEEFQRFVQARTHVLSERPEMTFTLASSLPDSSLPAKAANQRWSSGGETRPWIKYVNKPQTTNSCLMTLVGHSKTVRSCAVSPDCKRIASASDDNTLKIWDYQTGAELQHLKGHKSYVRSCAFSKNGEYLASGSNDKTVKIWLVSTGAELATLQGHQTAVNCVCFNFSGVLVASGSKGKIVITKIIPGGVFESLVNLSDEGQVFDCDFSSDDQYLATADGKKVTVRSTKTWETLHVCSHRNVLRVKFSPSNGDYLASASEDQTIKVWDFKKELVLTAMSGHKKGVTSIGFSPDGKRLVSGSQDNFIIIWDVETGESVGMITGHTGTVYHCVFSPDAKYLISCSFAVKIWEVSSAIYLAGGHSGRMFDAVLSKDGKTVITAAKDRKLIAWDSNGKELYQLSGHQGSVLACDISGDGQKIASASQDRTLRLWSAAERSNIAVMSHSLAVNEVRFAHDGKTIVSASADKLIKIWDVETGANLRTLFGHRGAVNCVDISEDGQRIVSCSDDSTIKMWDCRTGRKVATIWCGAGEKVSCCSLSPDGMTLLSATNSVINEWSSKNSKLLNRFTSHKTEVAAVTFSRNGNYFMSASNDSIILVWSNAAKKEVCSFAAPQRITTLKASSRSNTFVAGDGSGVLYIFEPQIITLW